MTNLRGFEVISPSDGVQEQINIGKKPWFTCITHAHALVLSMFYDQLIWGCLQMAGKQSMAKNSKLLSNS